LRAFQFTLHLSKDKPEDGPTIVHSTCLKISLKMALQLGQNMSLEL